MAAPAFRSFRTQAFADPDDPWSFTDPPTGTSQNDILLAWIFWDQSIPVYQGATGWTTLGTALSSGAGDIEAALAWKRAGASEAGPYSFDFDVAPQSGAVLMSAYSGCITSGDPYDDFDIVGLAAGTTHTSGTITTVGADRRIACMAAADLSATNTPYWSNWTNSAVERADYETPTFFVEAGLADYVLAAAGNTSFSVDSATSEETVAAIVALKGPDAVGGGWRRIVGPVQLASAAATLYTVPANMRTVIRHIHVYNPGGSTANVTLSIGTDAAATRIFDAYPVSADVPVEEGRKYVMTAGEILQGFASIGSQVVVTVTAEELVMA